MITEKLINKLEEAWEPNDGIFYQLRYDGILNMEKYREYIELLQCVEINGEQINRRLVSLIWYIPLFMSWQKERFLEKGGDIKQLENAISEVESIVMEVLGVP